VSIVVLENTDAVVAETADLTNEELGALTRLNWAMALEGGTLRNHPWLIRRLSRAGPRWKKICAAITAKLVVVGDRVGSKTLGKIEIWADPSARQHRIIAARQKGTHSAQEWDTLVDVFGGCVGCCTGSPVTKDHIVAVAAGGCDCIANLQPLCATCNSIKSTAEVDFRNLKKPGWVTEFLAAICPKEL
jgi:hypothetical protein